MKKYLLTICLSGLVTIANAQIKDTVKVITPGTLNELAKAYLTTVGFLTVTGTIDARDFKTMRDSMTSLVVLDLTNVTINGYTGVNGT
jgi:hypothetical protein